MLCHTKKSLYYSQNLWTDVVIMEGAEDNEAVLIVFIKLLPDQILG